MNTSELETQLKNMTVLYLQEDSAKRIFYTNMLKNLVPDVYVCLDIKETINEYAKLCPELLIADIGLEGSAELALLNTLRTLDEDLFILIISEHADAAYLQKAIELDVSSYLIEPVDQEQLEKAFYKIMQKSYKQKDKKSIYLDDDIYYEANIQTLLSKGNQIALNKKEARLLEYFLEYKNMLLSYAQIKKHIWPGLDVSSASIRTLVKNLRKKGMSDLIQNISGSGYLLQVSSH